MPAKRPPPPPLAYVLRTAKMRTEYKGTHAEGLELLFVGLPDALARRKVLDKLEKAHAKMLAREAGPDVEQAASSQVHPNSALPSKTLEQHEADECAANMNGHRFERVVHDGAEHCQWCGEARP